LWAFSFPAPYRKLHRFTCLPQFLLWQNCGKK